MKTILIHNQKGGVGKTTTAANLAAALARRGAGPVILADLDPQMHLTAVLASGQAPRLTAADWIAGHPGAAIAVAGEPGLTLVPGFPRPLAITALPPDACNWRVLDSSAHWDDSLACLARSADMVLCPLEPDFLGLSGANRLLQTLQQQGAAEDRVRFLICRYDQRLAIHREVRARLEARLAGRLLPFVIHASVRLAEAPGFGRTIFAHAPRSSGAADYARLAEALCGAEPRKRRAER